MKKRNQEWQKTEEWWQENDGQSMPKQVTERVVPPRRKQRKTEKNQNEKVPCAEEAQPVKGEYSEQ